MHAILNNGWKMENPVCGYQNGKETKKKEKTAKLKPLQGLHRKHFIHILPRVDGLQNCNYALLKVKHGSKLQAFCCLSK